MQRKVSTVHEIFNLKQKYVLESDYEGPSSPVCIVNVRYRQQ